MELSFAARLLALAIRNDCDDQGVFEWKPRTIKMRTFPADAIEIEPLLEELLRHDQVMPFTVDGRQYGAVRNFVKFQRTKSPRAQFPITPEVRKWVGYEDGDCGNDGPPDGDDCGNGNGSGAPISETRSAQRDPVSAKRGNGAAERASGFGEPSEIRPLREEGGGNREEGGGVEGGPGEGRAPPGRASRLPKDWSPPEDWIAFARGEGLNEFEVRRQSDRFRDYWLAQPGQKGVKADWLATWRNWIRREVDAKRARSPEPSKPTVEPGEGLKFAQRAAASGGPGGKGGQG